MSGRKLNFCRKFAIKTFPCYRCKCWHWKSEVFPYITWYVLGSHWWNLNQIVLSKMYIQFFELFWQKLSFFKTISDKSVDAILKMFLLLKQVFNGKLWIIRLISFGVFKNLKEPPNMADPTSMKHVVTTLNKKTLSPELLTSCLYFNK